jgi:AraC-like DNA-binding protein
MNSAEKLLHRPPVSEKLLVSDFLRRDGVKLDSPDDNLSDDDTLIEGRFYQQELREGLFLHVSDAVEERPFTATSYLSAGLSCIFFLDGSVDLKMGDRDFHFQGARGSTVEGTAIMNARSELFQRKSSGSQRLRHLVVSASPEWLDLDGLEGSGLEGTNTKSFSDHLANFRWTVTPRTVELLHQIVAPSSLTPALRKLYLESRTVELISETLAAITKSTAINSAGSILTQQDKIRLERAKEFIAANLTASMNMQVISRAAGINSSSLQKIFQLGEGMSVFEYIRQTRLQSAFALLISGEANIATASLVAGYSRPENFTTAFRRQFNITPRQALKRQLS